MPKGRTKQIQQIIRRFDAPRELVFTAFTDPEHLVRWWGPNGFKIVYCKLDMRPGGMVHYCARSSEGNLLWGRFEFHETLARQRIIFIHSFSDDHGETLNKVILTEQDGKTLLRLAIDDSENELYYNDNFDRLENYLPIITEKLIQHEAS